MDHKEGWAPKNWCFPIVVLEKILECPMDGMEIQPVNSKGNQLWIFTGRTDAEAPILWPTDAKSWLIGKDTYAGKDWEQEEKRVKEDQQVGWHHRLNGHESEQTLGDSEGQGSLVCCSPWGRKELDTTERLNWTDQILCNVSEKYGNIERISGVFGASAYWLMKPIIASPPVLAE